MFHRIDRRFALMRGFGKLGLTVHNIYIAFGDEGRPVAMQKVHWLSETDNLMLGFDGTFCIHVICDW